MSELFAEKKQMLKELIKALHAGARPEEVKQRFQQVLHDIGPLEIARVEEELIKEGLPREEVHRLCDVHLAVFKEQLERPKTEAPPGHPIHILLKEHEFVKACVAELSTYIPIIERAKEYVEIEGHITKVEELLKHLKEYEKHKVREENSLFPYLEKHGVSQPPAIMWTEHNQQRAEIKEATKALASRQTIDLKEFKPRLLPHLTSLASLIPSHFYKEENILFPTALQLLSDKEWREVKASMDELGYCYFTPKEAIGQKVELVKEVKGQEGEIGLETGAMTIEELEAVLNALPLDITFVDAEDTVRYFNQPKERLFPRAKAVIGRKVQQCHPQKSLHLVEQILSELRSGQRDSAEFWIDAKGRKVYIRYFAVRDAGRYLGCVEVTQDITEIQKLQGEKRLL